MNHGKDSKITIIESFRPQQGLTIMNNYKENVDNKDMAGFRPQQGLTIMNTLKEIALNGVISVSVPNRG